MVQSQRNGVHRMTEEHKIMLEIMQAVSSECIIFRVNVAAAKTMDGRWITTGVPKGYSDLSGHRKRDGKAVYIEVKTKTGRPSKEQVNFLHRMRETGAIAGICRSAEDALTLIKEEQVYDEF